MRNQFLSSLIVLILVACSSFIAANGQQQQNKQTTDNRRTNQELQGNWEGTVEVGANRLRLVLEISRAADGSYTGTFISVNQASQAPITLIRQTGESVRIEALNGRVVFEGTLSGEGSTMSGNLTQGQRALPVTFRRAATAVLRRPQMPQRPFPYTEENVTYENRRDGVRLAGTLTLPRGNGRFPAVLIMPGTGGIDRDGTIANHRLYLVLADYLTLNGIAVLRADKRGVGGSTGSIATSSVENYTEDTLMGVDYLKRRREINPNRIGLIGHSEGSVVAPLTATRSSDVAFLIMIGAVGLPREAGTILQVASSARAQGASDATIAKVRAIIKRAYTVVRQERDRTIAERRLREEVGRMVAALTDEERRAFGRLDVEREIQTLLSTSPSATFYRTYDPSVTLRRIKIPVLAVTGERDLATPPNENLSAVETALRAAGNRDYTIRILPNLNHNLQTSRTGLESEYGEIEETMSPTALELIKTWILRHASGS
jgi:uncharacterized protein